MIIDVQKAIKFYELSEEFKSFLVECAVMTDFYMEPSIEARRFGDRTNKLYEKIREIQKEENC